MKLIYFEGLCRWRDREIAKAEHYKFLIRQTNLKEEEKKIMEKRIIAIDELIECILTEHERIKKIL